MHTHCSPTTPQLPKQLWFGLFPVRSPLLRESLFVFSSSGYLDVSVLRVCVFRQYHFMILGCPIRKSTDQWIFPPTRSLSQVITSFIAFESQGILHAPLLTFFVFYFCCIFLPICQRTVSSARRCVENIGVEPMTPCVQGRCSSQLS
jgi:hypothetical protein